VLRFDGQLCFGNAFQAFQPLFEAEGSRRSGGALQAEPDILYVSAGRRGGHQEHRQ
jgi:hypothetical protein